MQRPASQSHDSLFSAATSWLYPLPKTSKTAALDLCFGRRLSGACGPWIMHRCQRCVWLVRFQWDLSILGVGGEPAEMSALSNLLQAGSLLSWPLLNAVLSHFQEMFSQICSLLHMLIWTGGVSHSERCDVNINSSSALRINNEHQNWKYITTKSSQSWNIWLLCV